MDDLAIRLAALDPEAASAVRVIAHFDALQEARAGLQSIVRAAAVLAGCPVRLRDPARRLPSASRSTVSLSVPTGSRTSRGPRRPSPRRCRSLARAVGPTRHRRGGGAGACGGRRPQGPGPHPRTECRRPRPGRSAPGRPSPEADRLPAARRMGLPPMVRAVAVADGAPRGWCPPMPARWPPGQVGFGSAVTVGELPASSRDAQLALSLTAAGTPDDPGPSVVRADDLGALPLWSGRPC